MKTDNRFEPIDRAAAKPVVSCEVEGTRFYLTVDKTASDKPDRAMIFPYSHDATIGAIKASDEWKEIPYGYRFRWEPGFLVNNEFVAMETERLKGQKYE